MSYVAATLIDENLGRFICGIYPEHTPDRPMEAGDNLGIIVRRDLEDALNGLTLILLLLKTKTAEVQINTDELAAYLDDAHELLSKLTRLGELCQQKMEEEEAELQDLLDELDEDAVDEVMACECDVCTEASNAN